MEVGGSVETVKRERDVALTRAEAAELEVARLRQEVSIPCSTAMMVLT